MNCMRSASADAPRRTRRTYWFPESSTVRAAPGHVVRELDGEPLILNLRSGLYYGLNATGTKIWNMVQKPMSVGDILDALSDECEEDPDGSSFTVMSLLHDLELAGLIEVDDEAEYWS